MDVVFNGMNSSNYAFNILSDNVTVVGFGFVGYFAGIVADNVNNLSIVNNTFNIGIEGVGITYSHNVNILDNVFKGDNDSDYGVRVLHCEYVDIVGNDLSDMSVGVYVSESDNVNVSNNTLANHSVYGVSLQTADNCSILDNRLENNSNYAISIKNGNSINIENNTVKSKC